MLPTPKEDRSSWQAWALCLFLLLILVAAGLAAGYAIANHHAIGNIECVVGDGDGGLGSSLTEIEAAIRALEESGANDRGQLQADLQALRDGVQSHHSGHDDGLATISHALESLRDRTASVEALYTDLAASLDLLAKKDKGKGPPDCPPPSKEVFDPLTGCLVTSQEFLDARNALRTLVFEVSAPYNYFYAFVNPADETITVSVPQWDEVSVAHAIQRVNETVVLLTEASSVIPGLSESERSELAAAGANGDLFYLHPVVMAFQVTGFNPEDNPVFGMFYYWNTEAGENLMAQQVSLDSVILYWNNFADSMPGYIGFFERNRLEDIVAAKEDLDRFRDFIPDSVETGTAIVNTTAYEPFLSATPAQQLAAQQAYQRCRDAAADMLTFITPAGAYASAAAALRGDANPGLGAPGLDSASAEEAYRLARLFSGTTTESAAVLHAQGLAQVALAQAGLVAVANSIVPLGPLQSANWTDFKSKENDAEFNSYFFENQTVPEWVTKQHGLIREAREALVGAFGFMPRHGFTVIPFPVPQVGGFYLFAGTADDGTASVINSNGLYITFLPPSIFDFDTFTFIEGATFVGPITGQSNAVFHELHPGHGLENELVFQTACVSGDPFVPGATEGWAMYAERVAAFDMGLAPNDTELGRLRLMDFWQGRLFRAWRMVCDTGLHHLGWSKAQTQAYGVANNYFDPAVIGDYVAGDIFRSITWPGQLLSYLPNALFIESERSRAEGVLGGNFILREWHDLILKYNVPIDWIVKERTDWYICQKLADTFDDNFPFIVPQPVGKTPPALTTCLASVASTSSSTTPAQVGGQPGARARRSMKMAGVSGFSLE